MALSTGIGAETQKPLAVVVIGGLVSATLLVLFVMPVLYVLLARFKGRRRAASEHAPRISE
jgi:cobalt-zinc-cadmium resistance protein CzcA